MISESAKTSIKSMFSHNLDLSLNIAGTAGEWTIENFPDYTSLQTEEIFMLVISSYDFRMLVVLHFSALDPSVEVIGKMRNIELKDMPTVDFYDSISDIANVFCGGVKRDIGNAYSHIGMSTPNRLSKETLMAYTSLEQVYQIHVKATHTSGVMMAGSAFITNTADMDFNITLADTIEEDAGELEFF